MATTRQTKLLFWWHTLNLKPTMNRCRYQQSYIGTGHTPWIQLRPHLHVYKEDLNPHSLLQSQKSGWVNRRAVIGQIIQRIFSRTLLATYSPSLSVQLCEVTSINLPSTEEFYCTSCPGQSDFPKPTSLVSLLEQDTPRKGRVYEHYKYYVQNTQSYPAIRRVKRRVV